MSDALPALWQDNDIRDPILSQTLSIFNCRATRLMAGPVASSKNVTRDFALVAGDRSASIYCTSIADSSPSASSADDLPNTISCAISRRHSFKRRCSVRI
jgi:hypothetical protein